MRQLPLGFDIAFGTFLCTACIGLVVWAVIDGQVLRGIGFVLAAAIAGPGRIAQRRRQLRRSGRT